MTLTTQQIKDLLEQQFIGCRGQIQSTKVLQISNGLAYSWRYTQPAPSVANPNCDFIWNVTFTPTDLSNPAAPVVSGPPEALVVNGVVQNPTRTYRVTVNNFIATGGDNFSVLTGGANSLGGAQDIDALVAYLAAFRAPNAAYDRTNAAVYGRRARDAAAAIAIAGLRVRARWWLAVALLAGATAGSGTAQLIALARVLAEGEQRLAAGDAAGAEAAFDRAAGAAHDHDVEISLVRAYMQAGDYRRALAFAAHAAGAHGDDAGHKCALCVAAHERRPAAGCAAAARAAHWRRMATTCCSLTRPRGSRNLGPSPTSRCSTRPRDSPHTHSVPQQRGR